MSIEEITGHDITTRVRCRGWDLERAMTTPKLEKNKTFEYKGNYYTINELYKMRINKDLTKDQIENRILGHNWDIERAISQPNNTKKQPKGTGSCLFEYNGKMYKSYELVELSPVKGLKPVDITTRINRHGWSVERAITQPLKNKNQLFEYNGKKYTSKQLAEISQVEGLTYHDITDRINRCGWSVRDAITKDKRK